MKTIEFSDLKIDIDETDGQVTYIFNGDVDENFDHKKVPIVEHSTITLHLAELKTFNSVGIREWINFVSKLSSAGTLIFKECSVPMIDQINMVPESLGNGSVESFYAPYYCDCGQEINKLVVTNEYDEQLKNSIAPSFECSNCHKELEFDALEESYFQFASTVLKVS